MSAAPTTFSELPNPAAPNLKTLSPIPQPASVPAVLPASFLQKSYTPCLWPPGPISSRSPQYSHPFLWPLCPCLEHPAPLPVTSVFSASPIASPPSVPLPRRHCLLSGPFTPSPTPWLPAHPPAVPARVGELHGGQVVHDCDVDEAPSIVHHVEQSIQVWGAATRTQRWGCTLGARGQVRHVMSGVPSQTACH